MDSRDAYQYSVPPGATRVDDVQAVAIPKVGAQAHHELELVKVCVESGQVSGKSCCNSQSDPHKRVWKPTGVTRFYIAYEIAILRALSWSTR